MKMVSEKIKAIWDINMKKCSKCGIGKVIKRKICEKCYEKERHLKNKSYNAEVKKRYHQKHKKERNRYSRQYYLEHKDYFREYYKKYYKKNKESLFSFLDSEDLAKDTLLSGT